MRKFYESPEYEVENFTIQDVLTISSSVDEGEDEVDDNELEFGENEAGHDLAKTDF